MQLNTKKNWSLKNNEAAEFYSQFMVKLQLLIAVLYIRCTICSGALTTNKTSTAKLVEISAWSERWKNMKFHKLTHSLAAHFSISRSIPSLAGAEHDDASRIKTTAPRKWNKNISFRDEKWKMFGNEKVFSFR